MRQEIYYCHKKDFPKLFLEDNGRIWTYFYDGVIIVYLILGWSENMYPVKQNGSLFNRKKIQILLKT